ncbi:MAG: alpha-amylase/4-alpha-glucanotransferase domain-containing protein [Planctomycetaceae bacterium]
MTQLRLVLALHNHQPVGNFDGVFEAAAADSYRPFLEVLADYPQLPISLHTSGSLLEWIVEHDPEYVDRLRGFVERGQIEILGGPFYEPILACIPRRDRIGQIRAYTQFLEQTFGCHVRGLWVPERVWEQTFTGDITDAGIEYTIVDDFHFRGAGLSEERLHGYYLTEDEGRLLKIFPGSERLRYTIPFQDPQATIDYLRHIAETNCSPVVAFGDDGEKFGTWPGTHKHVYEDGWLRRFFDALMANQKWLKVATLAEAVDQVAPIGRVYLPDSSYREMTEWALPTQQQMTYQHLVHAHEHDADWGELKQFVRAGFWRNFLVKYPESNEMYCRMREISGRLESLAQTDTARMQPELLHRARTELYRGQCNCPYWHGAFGGLYLPHLRNAIYKHLIAADTAVEELAGRDGKWVHVEADDYNLDARKEVRIASDRLAAYLAPARGGHLYELDLRGPQVNLLATLNRRPEPYHQKVRNHAAHQENGDGGGAVSIHDLVHFKQPDLDQKLTYDRWPRKSLVDHFLRPGLSLDEFERGEGEIGDFVKGVYDTRLRRSDRRAEAVMRREGHAGEHALTLTKTVALDTSAGGRLKIDYELENLPVGVPLCFAVEFNFAAMAAGADDRYFYGPDGGQLGQLQSVNQLEDVDRIGLVDEWLGVDASLDLSRTGTIWTFPIQTVSQSEGGFELVHQSAAVVPHWDVIADNSGCWRVSIELTVDTSAARARQLAAAVVV